jgi:hypothetical protein
MKVRENAVLCVLAVLLFAGLSGAAEKNDYRQRRNSSTFVDKKAQTIIFPVTGKSKKSFPAAERVLSGYFTGSGKGTAVSGRREDTDTEGKTKKKTVSRRRTESSIAWFLPGQQIYHDPLLECASGSEKIWVSDLRELCGFFPCEECFRKTGRSPEFIRREFKESEIASAAALIDERGFLAWLQGHFPVKNPGFVSTRKLIVYPLNEMPEDALKQLTREIGQAFRRLTWRVIEVVGKKSELDPQNISSFDVLKEERQE